MKSDVIAKCWREYRNEVIGITTDSIQEKICKAIFYAGFVKSLEVTKDFSRKGKMKVVMEAMEEMVEMDKQL